jgi:hypothetical protein
VYWIIKLKKRPRTNERAVEPNKGEEFPFNDANERNLHAYFCFLATLATSSIKGTDMGSILEIFFCHL